MVRVFFFLLGFGLMVIGCSFIILYLNLTTMEYNFLEYVNFIIRRVECYFSIIGFIIMILSITLKGDIENELYLWYSTYFNKEYYNFFEWNKRDNIVNVKKIPLFLVNNDTFKMFKYDNVTVSSDFINLIKDKTYTYSRIKIGNTSLITNGKEVIAVLFNDKGELIKRSSLLLDEEEEVLNETSNDSIYNIDIVKSSRNKISFVNRSQKEKKNFLIKYINKENNLTNLKYLYYDYFEKEVIILIILKSL